MLRVSWLVAVYKGIKYYLIWQLTRPTYKYLSKEANIWTTHHNTIAEPQTVIVINN